VTPPRWVDEHGQPRPRRPCHRCGVPVPVAWTFRLEHLRMIGWSLFSEAGIVEWCGHEQRFLVVPHADGVRAAVVPIVGEAA